MANASGCTAANTGASARWPGATCPATRFSLVADTIAKLRWDPEIKTYEHWEFFYRASHLEKLKIAVAEDCMVVHAHVGAKPYGDLRCRPKFRKLGLRKHGFHSMRYPGGGIVHA